MDGSVTNRKLSCKQLAVYARVNGLQLWRLRPKTHKDYDRVWLIYHPRLKRGWWIPREPCPWEIAQKLIEGMREGGGWDFVSMNSSWESLNDVLTGGRLDKEEWTDMELPRAYI